VAFDGIVYNATDTASLAASYLMRLKVGGVDKFTVRKDGVIMPVNVYAGGSGGYALFNDNGLSLSSTARVAWTGTGNAQNAQDLQLWRDAANVLAQRNGANAQAFRLYNTYTDASNYERGFASWSTNLFQIGTEKAGTGVARNVQFLRDGTTHITLSGSVTIGNVNLLFSTDNSYDIGASGANRPRNAYFGGTGQFGGSVTAGNSGFLTGRMWINTNAADGVVMISNFAGTNFGRLQFGGTTSSFPALKRNTDQLEARLADDSNYTPFVAQRFSMVDGVTEPAATVGQAKLYVDAADGDLKVKFGDGTVKTIVTDT
jgi:hypothetical protein